MIKTSELFDDWNKKKKEIEFFEKKEGEEKIQGRIGEFRWYHEGVNIGNEISKDGKFMRVCFVLQNSLGNGLLLVAPITTKYHERMNKYYVKVNNFERYGLKECRMITNQIRLIDQKRLVNITGIYNPHLTLVPIVIEQYIRLIKKIALKPK